MTGELSFSDKPLIARRHLGKYWEQLVREPRLPGLDEDANGKTYSIQPDLGWCSNQQRRRSYHCTLYGQPTASCEPLVGMPCMAA